MKMVTAILIIFAVTLGFMCLVQQCHVIRGYLLLIKITFHYLFYRKTASDLVKMLKETGDVILLSVFGKPVVLVFSKRAAKEVLKNPELNNRPPFYCNRYLAEGKSLAWNGQNDDWTALHKLSVQATKSYAISEEYIRIVNLAAEDFLHHVELKTTEQPMCLESYVEHFCHTLRFDTIYGSNIDESTKAYLINETNNLLDMVFMQAQANIINYFPLTKKLFSGALRKIQKMSNNLCDVHQNFPLQAGTLVYSFSQNPMARNFLPSEIQSVAQDCFAAGLHTVSALILWIVAYLGVHQDWQEVIYNELVSFLEEKSMVVMPCDFNVYAYKDNLANLSAFIYEVMRLSPTVTFALPHQNRTTASIGDIEIPPNAIIMVCLQEALIDGSHWKNPQEFNPHRFIYRMEKLGKKVINKVALQNMIGHGAGDRKCLGHKMSLTEAFAFTTKLVLNYRILPYKDIDLQPSGIASLVSKPKRFYVYLKHR